MTFFLWGGEEEGGIGRKVLYQDPKTIEIPSPEKGNPLFVLAQMIKFQLGEIKR